MMKLNHMSFCLNDYFNDAWGDMKTDKNVFCVTLLQDY